ncbi:hypothetical protein [Novosphingobium naphthalenivorans]|uniref:hypothetical protein n=1 Tax=Novosphingobium naphthalenivorans TaxID=273168 RepID=UPI0008330F87|nr:hypothetical protein [Novosphingobium naphthalenivorans]
MARLMYVRVKSQRPLRRRAGFAFTREVKELQREAFGQDEIAAIEKLLALVGDPVLDVVLVQADGSEQRLTTEEADALRTFVAAQKSATAPDEEKAEANALLEQLLSSGDDETELQPPSGATGNAEGDASASGAPGASGDASDSEDASLTPPGTEPSSADGSAHSRQVADEPAADRKAGADEQNTAEATPAKPRGRAKATDATVK